MTPSLIVFDNLSSHFKKYESPNCINFDSYLKNYPKLNQSKVKVINLCDTDKYLSEGYYCSLLAEARNHTVVPSVKTLNEIRDGVSFLLSEKNCHKEELLFLQKYSFDEPIYVFFGKSYLPNLKRFSHSLYKRYSTPILKVEKGKSSDVVAVSSVSPTDLPKPLLKSFTEDLFNNDLIRWNSPLRSKRFRWDLAILVNPKEKTPPSDQRALKSFVKAASQLRIQAHIVTIDELFNISKYDAIFIRETTAIDHYTYRLVCEAEAQGLVVIDDSNSILRCCNKVFLQDAFTYNKVPSLRSRVVSRFSQNEIKEIENDLVYPMVVKTPEGSFSTGVFKVENRTELRETLEKLFTESSLVLLQEYMYTDYDWRIGVLNGRALYACRYYMARNHWQIYNHKSSKDFSGRFDCLPTFEVPKNVLQAALKASKMIGTGLYGVDVKEYQNNAYVIEVNDNPSIEHDCEDQYLGEELYMQIMSEFLHRLEARGR